MPVDSCPYTFEQLARKRLPLDMKRMRQAMAKPHSMEMFGRKGVGTKTVLRGLGLDRDFPGCYVLLSEEGSVYVGTSRGVIQRLLQQAKGMSQSEASLAHRIASETQPTGRASSAAKHGPAFQSAFEMAKDYLKSLQVAFVPIEDDLELYLFQVYCAMELDTCIWNTFRRD